MTAKGVMDLSLSKEELKAGILSRVECGEGIDVFENDCDIIVFMLENCEISIPEQNRFFVRVSCEWLTDTVTDMRRRPFSHLLEDAGLGDGVDALAYTGMYDISHTSAEWESVISLGIYGLRERIAEYAQKNSVDDGSARFYSQCLRVYGAALDFMDRASQVALEMGRDEMSRSLARLCIGAPTDLYGALQTSVVYYTLQQFFDGTVLRTFGRLDSLLYPYYIKEDKEKSKGMLLDYIKEIDRFKAIANVPFAIGGTDADGNDLINELSYVLLDTYAASGTADTKLHLLCSAHTPRDIIEKALRYVRDGRNSIVFISDRRVIEATELYEAHYPSLHSAPILSGTYTSALEKGGDLYRDHTAKYNSSSLNAIGLATATDSLAAIKKAVFDDGAFTLREFTDILRSDWEGKEPLRLYIKNKYPKYGQGNAEIDAIAKDTVDALSSAVSCKPNSKGGKWRLGLFSIDWRWEFGRRTAASADGRRQGETLSQNTSASFGADREGATAHLISASRLDTSKTPNGAIVDIDLHSSSVRGENGICALVASLLAYFELGGFAVHYNVLDNGILTAAKREPEKYPTLQVRLCGWNVLFSSLSEAEKDEFIQRSAV